MAQTCLLIKARYHINTLCNCFYIGCPPLLRLTMMCFAVSRGAERIGHAQPVPDCVRSGAPEPVSIPPYVSRLSCQCVGIRAILNLQHQNSPDPRNALLSPCKVKSIYVLWYYIVHLTQTAQSPLCGERDRSFFRFVGLFSLCLRSNAPCSEDLTDQHQCHSLLHAEIGPCSDLLDLHTSCQPKILCMPTVTSFYPTADSSSFPSSGLLEDMQSSGFTMSFRLEFDHVGLCV